MRKTPPDTRVEEELRQQVARRESELETARRTAAEAASARASADAVREGAEAAAAQNRAESQSWRAQSESIGRDLAACQVALATAQAEVESSRRLLAEQRRFHEDNEREIRENQARIVAELRTSHERAVAELRDAFKALSSDALRQSAPEFLRLAQETFARFQETAKGDLATREQRIETLVRPLEEQLKTYQQRLQQAEASQFNALGEVKKHLETLAGQSQVLSSETQRLRVVLSSNQARGRWGEETLRRVVEAAGLSTHCDFVEQVAEGEGRPDLIVRLPGERAILVDSKVPDLDFLNALHESDELKRAQALATHAARLRGTIKALADRDYPKQFPNALDYVVLFLPAESLFSAALEGDRDLIVWAAERHILLATPASLIALLRSVSISWQQHEQSQNAREIAAAAQQLYERVVKFTEHFDRIRDGLLKTTRAFDDAVGSYDRMIRPSGERLVKLGGGNSTKELPEITALEVNPRSIPPRT